MVSIDSSYILGILFALLAAIFYALTTLLVKCLEGVRPHLIALIHSASGRGVTGIEELKSGSLQIIKTPSEPLEAKRFPVALAFNLIPSIDVLLDNHFTLEEQKMLQELRKILNRPDLDVSATCVRVPVINCHSEAGITCEFGTYNMLRVLAALRNENRQYHYAQRNLFAPSKQQLLGVFSPSYSTWRKKVLLNATTVDKQACVMLNN
ncbi:DUF2817 domain-containing protein [Dendronalium phyllosphericum]|nr:DUF2817 domain-containing protein [Dendronalium phyllosphericum]